MFGYTRRPFSWARFCGGWNSVDLLRHHSLWEHHPRMPSHRNAVADDLR